MKKISYLILFCTAASLAILSHTDWGNASVLDYAVLGTLALMWAVWLYGRFRRE